MVLLAPPAILVFFWMLSLSLKNEADNTAFPPVFIPNPPTLANFAEVLRKNDFLQYTLDSIIVSFSATEVALPILIARITPGLSYLIRLFLLFQWLKLTETLLPVVITHLVITVPIVVYIMIGFFEKLPPELEEAALVDGATIGQAFRFVALPLARPGITLAAIVVFIFSWNNFIFGVVLAGRETRKLPVAVYNVLKRADLRAGQLGAAGGGALGDLAGAVADAADAEGDRSGIDRRRREGRIGRAGLSYAQSLIGAAGRCTDVRRPACARIHGPHRWMPPASSRWPSPRP